MPFREVLSEKEPRESVFFDALKYVAFSILNDFKDYYSIRRAKEDIDVYRILAKTAFVNVSKADSPRQSMLEIVVSNGYNNDHVRSGRFLCKSGQRDGVRIRLLFLLSMFSQLARRPTRLELFELSDVPDVGTKLKVRTITVDFPLSSGVVRHSSRDENLATTRKASPVIHSVQAGR